MHFSRGRIEQGAAGPWGRAGGGMDPSGALEVSRGLFSSSLGPSGMGVFVRAQRFYRYPSLEHFFNFHKKDSKSF